MFKNALSVSVAKPNVWRGNRGRIAVKSLRIGGPGSRLIKATVFLELSTAVVLHDAYWGGCRFLKQGMVWEIGKGG